MANYIRFDWAMKRLLRNKANFGVLEGLLTTLLDEKITISQLLESESNQEDEFDKYNRVDLLALDSKGELILIEVQNNNEYAYFQRMLFGVSKLVTEYINRGEGYENVRKVYSVNIVYFSLGHGKDIVYHGKTEFRGIHENDILELTPFQRQTFKVDAVSQLYPEYYILKVNDFNKVAKTPLEEWIYYLNTGEIPETAHAPGLAEVRERLKVDGMTKGERGACGRPHGRACRRRACQGFGDSPQVKGHGIVRGCHYRCHGVVGGRNRESLITPCFLINKKSRSPFTRRPGRINLFLVCLLVFLQFFRDV